MQLIYTTVIEKIAARTDPVELLEQHINLRWSGTWQQLDVFVMWAKCLASEDVSHVVLRDHGALVLGHVVAICYHGVVEVTLVGNILGEVIYSDLDHGWVVGHGN